MCCKSFRKLFIKRFIIINQYNGRMGKVETSQDMEGRMTKGFDISKVPLEEAAEYAAKLFVEIYLKLEQRKIDPGMDFKSLVGLFENTILDEGIGLIETLEEFHKKVLPNSIAIPHPLYLGLVNSSPLPAAALADLLVSALNNNDGGVPHSLRACEEEVIRAFRDLYELPNNWTGIVLPGGAFTILQGIILARANAFPEVETQGLSSLKKIPRIYTSESAHFTIARAAKIIGIGEQNVISVRTTGRGSMDVQALKDAISEDRKAGRQPFAVAATVGTTGTGAVDPLKEISELCTAEKLWLHVDACYGGAARLVPKLQSLFQGIEQADSISIDPHKWFFIPITAGLLLTKHRNLECQVFALNSGSYLPGNPVTYPLWRGVASSRRSSGFAIWMALRAHGWNTVRTAVTNNIRLIRKLELLLKENGFTILEGGQLSVACAQWEPEDCTAAKIDDLQVRIASEIVASGKAWFSTVRHDGKTWLRFNLLNIYTKESHIDFLAKLVTKTARQLASSSSD